MASARITFDFKGILYTLYFGMASTRVFEEKAVADYEKLKDAGNEEPEGDDYDSTKGFANIVHSGLCNQADIDEVQRPKFSESYELAEGIAIENPDLVTEIFNCWNESRPVSDMLERMKNVLDQAQSEKKNMKRKIGTKSKRLPSVNSV